MLGRLSNRKWSMKNHTDCVIVVRTYYYEVRDGDFEEVRIKEFIFRGEKVTRRYCMFLTRKGSRIYEVTEHAAEFFEKVVSASNGWPLFHLYMGEKIDPVPINGELAFVSNTKKYQYLKEFYVVFNATCCEKRILEYAG